MRLCPKCKIQKPISDFYSRRNKEGCSSYCKLCSIKQTLERQKSFKEKCLAYMGDICSICGYYKCSSALEFHHKEPHTKDFSISHARLTTFNEVVKSELDKCILVCANCHRELHEKLNEGE